MARSIFNAQIMRIQATTYSGRTVRSVKLSERGNFLIVNRKRERSNVYENYYYHIHRVLAFCEGTTDAAYATVMSNVVLRRVEGPIIKNPPGLPDAFVSIRCDGETHCIRVGGNDDGSATNLTETTNSGG